MYTTCVFIRFFFLFYDVQCSHGSCSVDVLQTDGQFRFTLVLLTIAGGRINPRSTVFLIVPKSQPAGGPPSLCLGRVRRSVRGMGRVWSDASEQMAYSQDSNFQHHEQLELRKTSLSCAGGVSGCRCACTGRSCTHGTIGIGSVSYICLSKICLNYSNDVSCEFDEFTMLAIGLVK